MPNADTVKGGTWLVTDRKPAHASAHPTVVLLLGLCPISLGAGTGNATTSFPDEGLALSSVVLRTA